MLRLCFEIDVRLGTLRFPAERFAYCRSELDRQRGLDANERQVGWTTPAPHLDAIGRMRIDNDAVAGFDPAYRRDAIGVRAAPGRESRATNAARVAGLGKIESAVLANVRPQL